MRTKTKHIELKDNWFDTDGTMPTRKELESQEWIPTYFYLQTRGEIFELTGDVVKSTSREDGIVTTRSFKHDPKRDKMFFRRNEWYFWPCAENRINTRDNDDPTTSFYQVLDCELKLLYNDRGEFEKVLQKSLRKFDITFTYNSKTEQNPSSK